MRPRSLDEFLKRARVPYIPFTHPAAFTAQSEAQLAHVPGWSWAKVVVCIADDEPILAVVPAPMLVDFEQVRLLAGACAVRLATEAEFATLYPDCEPGAMPPFGNLYFQRVFVDRSLVGEPDMVFNAGTHTDAIRMHYGDFADIVHPVVGTICCAGPARAPQAGAYRGTVRRREEAV
jgi:Ala-tRNA(Pro) deacylase